MLPMYWICHSLRICSLDNIQLCSTTWCDWDRRITWKSACLCHPCMASMRVSNSMGKSKSERYILKGALADRRWKQMSRSGDHLIAFNCVSAQVVLWPRAISVSTWQEQHHWIPTRQLSWTSLRLPNKRCSNTPRNLQQACSICFWKDCTMRWHNLT